VEQNTAEVDTTSIFGTAARHLITEILQQEFLVLPTQPPLNGFSWISSAADTAVEDNLGTKPHLVLPDPLISINIMNAVLHLMPT